MTVCAAVSEGALVVCRVLMVEDSPGDAALTTAALRQISGYRFEVTVTPTIAEALAECHRADVVLLDVNLPDACRLEGLEALRVADREVPIILLTGDSDLALAEAALTVGAQDYLLKDELTAAALERSIRYARSRHELMVRVEASERWAKALIHSVSDIVTIHGLDGSIQHVGGSGAIALGWPAEISVDGLRRHVDAATWRRMRQVFVRWLRRDMVPFEFSVDAPDGEVRHLESVATDLRHDPLIRGIVVTTRDVTARHRIEQRLSHEVLHDALTGLPNRTCFNERLSHALTSSTRGDAGVAVLVIDLDDFKKINDSYGHPAGDEVLQGVTQALSTAVRGDDTLARLGGDEFVVVCPDVTPDAVDKIARRLHSAMLRPFSAAGRAVYLTASIGAAVAAAGIDISGPELFRNADLALYESKRAGRNRITTFDQRLEQQALRRMELESELRHAIPRRELSVVYQPVIDLASGEIVSYEALLRWTNERFGDVPAEEFISLAEDCGLIATIGAWVLEQACMQLAEWRRERPGTMRRVAVNISTRQLVEPDFVADIQTVLDRCGVPAESLCLEVTETALMSELVECSRTLDRIRELGVGVALDDFGTGYSSLAYLKQLPVDILKLDRSFIERIDTDPQEQALVATVCRMAQALSMDVVAEGVETTEQCLQLRRLGCGLGQGFLWSAALASPVVAERWEVTFDTGCAGAAPGITSGARDGRQPMRDLTETTAFLVHELMQPITVVRSFASVFRDLVDKGDTAQLVAVADAINRNASTIETLVRTLADTGAVDRDALQLETTPVMLLPVVREIIDDLAPTLPVTIDLREGDDAEVDLDLPRFRQIVTNLLTNAAKFSPPGTHVEIRAGRDGERVAVSVVDSGPGVPPDREPELFGKFAKLGRHKGTGVGLYLSRRLARLHGGDITYRRADTGGAQFTVTLPCHDAGARGHRPPAAAAGHARRSSEAPLGPRSVDDPAALAALHAATRRLLTARTPEAVVGISIGLVRDLGGTVLPAAFADPASIPADIAMGEGPPLLPTAPPLSTARLRLEQLLPMFLEDARDILQECRIHARKAGTDIHPATALLSHERLVRRLRNLRGDHVVIAVGADGGPDDQRELSRLLRSVAGGEDILGHWSDDVLIVVSPAPSGDERALEDSLRRQWHHWGNTAPLRSACAFTADGSCSAGETAAFLSDVLRQSGEGTVTNCA